MKNLKKKLAARGGFTLVELIVVIAILAILAGVAVPAYSGYVKKAEKAADLQNLDAIKTAVLVLAAEEGQNVASITVTGSNGTVSTVAYTTAGTPSVTVTFGGTGQSDPALTEVTDLTGVLHLASSFTTATWNASAQEWKVT